MAHDHHKGCVDCVAKHDSAVKDTASQGSRIQSAPPSAVAAAKKAPLPSSRRPHAPPPRFTTRSTAMPPASVPTAASASTVDAINPASDASTCRPALRYFGNQEK